MDAGGNTVAPMPVQQALITLALPEEVIASVCERQEANRTTEWHVLWLTKNHLIYVSASKAETDWDLGSFQQPHDKLDSWIRPVEDIVDLNLDELRADSLTDESVSWDVILGVTMRDGFGFTLPLFGQIRTRTATTRQQEEFWKALRSRGLPKARRN
jgi:hypothetical protein